MSGQDFDTLEELRLEVRDTPDGPYPLIPNRSGELGAWFWLSPLGSTFIEGGNGFLNYTRTIAGPSNFSSAMFPVQAGEYAAVKISRAANGGLYHRFYFEWFAANRGVIGSSALSAAMSGAGDHTFVTASPAPAGTRYAKLRVQVGRNSSMDDPLGSNGFDFWNVTVVSSTSAPAIANPWLYNDAPGWVNILGPTHDLLIDRQGLDVGTLTATVLDPDLDPAVDVTIRPGKEVRLIRAAADPDDEEELFSGKVLRGQTTYLRDRKANTVKPRIFLVAVDPGSTLAQAGASDVVGAIADLPVLLEDVGVPWSINGQTGHVITAEPVGRIERASVLDQVALARDTALGYAWVNRRGILNVWDRDQIETATAATFSDTPDPVIGGPSYTGVNLDWDSDRCINEVTVTVVSFDETGETQEITYGPFRDNPGIDQWGRHARDFKVSGAITAATVQAFAEAIFAVNATPQVRCNGLTYRVDADLIDLATTLDLYDVVGVELTGKYDESVRITGIRHRITAGLGTTGCRWNVEYNFETIDSVAQPSVVPSPGTGLEAVEGIWQTPTLSGSWANYGSAFRNVAYMRKNGVVHLTGLVKDGAANSAIFTLPEGFRPAGDIIVAAVAEADTSGASSAANSGASSQANTGTASGHQHPMPHQHSIAHTHPLSYLGVRLTITAAGVVSTYDAGTGWVSLAGISFPAEE